MRDFLINYGGTILVSVLIMALIVFAVKRIIKNKKNGKCSCGCESCVFKDNCRKK